jgi:anti-sigma regulatory factor (Ser/Thr protein kinase)
MHARRVAIRFPGSHDGVSRAFTRLRGVLDAKHLDGAPRYNVELVFEEIVSNIVRYGAVDGCELHLLVTLELHPDSIILTFDDDGIPFDPRGHTDAVPQRSQPEVRVGGFGLMLVRRAASSLEYVRTAEGRNRLTVRLSRADAMI